MSRLILSVLLGVLLVVPAHAADKIRIVASFSILGDMARQIAGDDTEVVALVGPDGDAHIFEPLPADAAKLASAKLVLVNGLGLDNWMDRLVAASGYKGPVVTLSKGVEPRTMVDTDSGSEQVVTDPHAWQDLANGVVYVTNIVDALSTADPANAGRYRAAGDRYIETLRALDGEVRSRIEKVPPAKRRVITSHDAFGYFGGAYGVEFLAPEGISTESEPSANRSGEADRPDQARAHQDAVRREHRRSPHDRHDRQGNRLGGRRPAVFRCAVAGRRPSAALCRHVQEQCRRSSSTPCSRTRVRTLLGDRRTLLFPSPPRAGRGEKSELRPPISLLPVLTGRRCPGTVPPPFSLLPVLERGEGAPEGRMRGSLRAPARGPSPALRAPSPRWRGARGKNAAAPISLLPVLTGRRCPARGG